MSHGSCLDVASRGRVWHAFKYLIRVQGESGHIDRGHEVTIRITKTTSAGGEALERTAADQNGHRLAAPSQLYGLAVLRFANLSR